MRFEKICPICLKQWENSMPDWSPDKRSSKPKPCQVKTDIVKQTVINNEMVITIKYPKCGHEVDVKRPYKNVNTIDGYVITKTGKGYIPEHRFIWEQAHGKLLPDYVVHHINGVKSDNRLENLVALPRFKHNSSMIQPEPMNGECPHCKTPLKVIKISHNKCLIA